MMKRHAVSVVSPVYNNATTMVPIIAQILSLLRTSGKTYELFLIDDGSTDGSQEMLRRIARSPHVRVAFHDHNQGTAKTYRELYRDALYEWVILFSLDGEWNPKDIRKLIAADSQAAMVIGRRKHKAYPVGRKIVSTLYNMLTRLLFGVETYDAGSIKRVSREVIAIPLVSQGVFDEAERIIKAQRLGFPIAVIDVEHLPSGKRRGVFQRLPLIIEAVRDLMRVFLSPTTSSPAATATTGKAASPTKSRRKAR